MSTEQSKAKLSPSIDYIGSQAGQPDSGGVVFLTRGCANVQPEAGACRVYLGSLQH